MATPATHIRPSIPREPAPLRQADPDSFRLRPLPNEDIFFHVKHIDNSAVVRQEDPKTPRRCWRTIGLAAAISAVAIALLVPGAYGIIAGYELQALQERQQQLLRERRVLEAEESRLLSAERLQELAEIQAFVDPAPGHVVYLEGEETPLAMNAEAKK
jgi:hypothetical protein